MEYYWAIESDTTERLNWTELKDEWNKATASQMDGPRDCHTEKASQTEKEKYCMTSLICEIYKEMMQMNLQKQRQTHWLNEFVVARGKDGGRDS